MCFWFSTTVEVNVTSMAHILICRCTLEWALNCFPYVIASIAWVSSSGNTNKAVGKVNFRLKEFLLSSLLTKLTFSHRWVSWEMTFVAPLSSIENLTRPSLNSSNRLLLCRWAQWENLNSANGDVSSAILWRDTMNARIIGHVGRSLLGFWVWVCALPF